MLDLIGQTMGQYRIIEQVGQGGMATVYKAYQPSLDRYVAVKVLPPYFAHEPGFAMRFTREARAVARLNHPNILPIYDFGQENDQSYIVMKYVEAGTLKDALGESLALEVAADVLRQIAAALDHAHQRGILHRDVKPSNVLLDEGQWVLLTDFGLAKMVEGSAVLTASGVGVGTPAYMAPEQGQGEQVGPGADVYSLGVVLFEMLTGRVPYEAETPMAVVIKHITEPLPLPRSLNPEMPDVVERVILKALAKNPDDRFASTVEMADALANAVAAATPPAPQTIEAPPLEPLPAPLPVTPTEPPVVSPAEPPAVTPVEPPVVSPAEPLTPEPEPAEPVPVAKPSPGEPVPTPAPPAAKAPVAHKPFPWKIVGAVAAVTIIALAAVFGLSTLGDKEEEATPTVVAAVAEEEAPVAKPAPTSMPGRESTPQERPPRPGGELREVQFEEVYLKTSFEQPGELRMDLPEGWEIGDDGSGNPVLLGRESYLLFPGGFDWTDYVLEARVMLAEGEEGAVYVRKPKSGAQKRGVRLSFAVDRWEFCQDPGDRCGASYEAHNKGEWHDLRVVAVKNHLAAFLDGELMFEAEIEFSYGTVGFGAHYDSTIFVDDLRVTGPPLAPRRAEGEPYDDFDHGFVDKERWEWRPAMDGHTAEVDDRGKLIIAAENPGPEPVLGELEALVDQPIVEVMADLTLEHVEGEHTNLALTVFAEGRRVAGIMGPPGEVMALAGEEGLHVLLEGKGLPAEYHLRLALTPDGAMHVFVDGQEIGAIPAPPVAKGFSVGYWVEPGGSLVGLVDNVQVQYAKTGEANEIVLWHTYSPDSVNGSVLVELIRRAQEAYPGLTVHLDHLSFFEIYDKYEEEVAAGSGPDIFLAHNDWLGDVARSGLVLNLDPYLAGKLDGFSEMGVEGMKVDGKLYGVPLSAKSVALYYNKSRVDAPPATVDELLDAVRTGAGMTFWTRAYSLFGWTGAFGGQLMDENGRCIADQGGWVEALEYLLALQEAGAVFEREYAAAQEPFRAGKTAFFANAPWALMDYLDALGEDLGIAPLPAGPGGPANPLTGMGGFYVNPNSQDVQAALDLALFLTSQESAQLWTDKASHVPVRRDVWPTHPLVGAFIDISTVGFLQPQNPEFSHYWEPFENLFSEVLEGRVAPAKAVARACAAMNAASELAMPREPEPYPCQDELGCVDVPPGEPVHIAFILAQSGLAQSLGIDSMRGVEIAVDYKGEVLGHPIALRGEDSGCSPEAGEEAASRIADDRSIVAVVGTTCSVAAAEAVSVISEAGLVMVSPSNSVPQLTDPGMHQPGYLRVIPNDKEQAWVIAQIAREEFGIERAATLYEEHAYSKALERHFAETFRELGAEIAIQAKVQPDEAQIRATLASVARTKPGLVFYPLFMEAGGLVTRLARETPGLEETILVGADRMFSPELLELAGPAAEGLYLSSPDLSAVSDTYEGFVGRYVDVYGQPPQSFGSPYAFDAATMIFEAIERVAVQTDDGALHIGREALREALFATRGFEGLTGVLTCTRHGDCADTRVIVYQVVSADPGSWEPGLNPVQVWP